MSRRKRRAYTPEFKADAVALVKRSGKSIGQVAKEMDLTETALRDWVRRADGEAPRSRSEALPGEEREELIRLRRENQQLKQEREFLKKAAAFFAKESK